MPRSQYLARQRGKAPTDIATADLEQRSTTELLAELEASTEAVTAGRDARKVRDVVLRALLHRPRSEVSIEKLMEITGYQRAMVYRYRSAGDDAE
jgi:light-regulated signal transduction histidine kinase (bacteriophytochrome)